MKILYIACGGFGDVSWSTSWPRVFSENGHEIDVFLVKYTSNPFHANPYIKNIFIIDSQKVIENLDPIKNNYDILLLTNEVIAKRSNFFDFLKTCKNLQSGYPAKISDFLTLKFTKPEFYFSGKESEFICKNYNSGATLFFPLSSAVTEETRNISLKLIENCAQYINNIIIVHGGRDCLPIEDLKNLESIGIKVLWENYNCFNDESGTVLGKQLALISQSSVSIHGYSGSINMALGYNHPYIVAVPKQEIRNNNASPYTSTIDRLIEMKRQSDGYSCFNPNIWCITNEAQDVIDAINNINLGKTGTFFNKTWDLK